MAQLLQLPVLAAILLVPSTAAHVTVADKDARYPTQRTVFNAVADGLIWTRIPSIVQVGGTGSPKLLAMAQCRYASGEPTNLTMALCAKLSMDDGATWGVRGQI